MGSRGDEGYCRKIAQHCKTLGLPYTLQVSSAHKSTEDVLKIISEYDGTWTSALRWKKKKRGKLRLRKITNQHIIIFLKMRISIEKLNERHFFE